jgi:hypothetical protein
MLRKRIQELQHYRRMGLTTAADIDKFEMDSIRRVRMPLCSMRSDPRYLTTPRFN